MPNPFLSLWLSGANAWLGVARGMASGEGARLQARRAREMGDHAVRLWAAAWGLAAAPPPAAPPWPMRRRLRVVEGGRRG